MNNPCREASLLSAFMDGELSASETQEVRRHLEACGRCRRQLADLQATERILTKMEQPEPSIGFDRAFWDKVADLETSRQIDWWKRYLQPAWGPVLAAGLVCGIIAAGWILNATSDSVSPEDLFMAENIEFLNNYDLIDNLEILENWDAIEAMKERT
jgi:anti-sigma factor RsiW